MERGVRRRVAGLPEPLTAAPHVPVRDVVDERRQPGRCGEPVELLERVGDGADGVVELGQDPAVEHVRRLRRLVSGSQRSRSAYVTWNENTFQSVISVWRVDSRMPSSDTRRGAQG